jgi:hypothetical protein
MPLGIISVKDCMVQFDFVHQNPARFPDKFSKLAEELKVKFDIDLFKNAGLCPL